MDYKAIQEYMETHPGLYKQVEFVANNPGCYKKLTIEELDLFLKSLTIDAQ